MVHYESNGVFDAPLDKVWELLEGHGDPETVTENHPSILDAEVLEEGEGWLRMNQTYDTPDGPMEMETRMDLNPPEGWTSEVLSGPFEGGTTTHTYEEEGSRTRVELEGDFPVPEGMSEEEVREVVHELYTTAYHEDQRALEEL